MVTVVIIFTACWLPFNILMVSSEQHTTLYSYLCVNWKQVTALSFSVYEWRDDYPFILFIWFWFFPFLTSFRKFSLIFRFLLLYHLLTLLFVFTLIFLFYLFLSSYLPFLICSSFLIPLACLIYLSFSLHLFPFPFLKSSLCNVHLCVRFEVVTMMNMNDDSLMLLHLS
jgi:hypothetical protein